MATHTKEDLLPQEAAPASGGNSDKKTVNMPVGVPGYTLVDEQREVPVTEPPVWPINKDLKYVGKSPERWDGLAKATGRARYTADVQLPGMLYAKFVNATVPHAKVVSVDTSAAERHPAVKGVHVIQHVMGSAVLRDPSLEQVKYPVVRYAGQPIAAVAATTPDAAEEAAALVKVQYEAIPFVVDLDKARATDAPLVFPGAADEEGTAGGGGGPNNVPQKGNIHGPSIKKVADVEQGFRDSEVVVEGRYITQVQTHSALETHGFVADWKPEMLTVWASTQGTASVREELSGYFKIPMTQVRVITEFMGGGFGAKFGAGNPGSGCGCPIEEDRRAGTADARPRRGASFRRQSSQFRPDAAYRCKKGWHDYRGSSGQLWHCRLRHGRGMRRPRNESLQVRLAPHRRKRCIHQCGSRHGNASAGPSAGSFRPGADHRRTCGQTQHGSDRPARPNRRTSRAQVERQIVRESELWKSRQTYRRRETEARSNAEWALPSRSGIAS